MTYDKNHGNCAVKGLVYSSDGRILMAMGGRQIKPAFHCGLTSANIDLYTALLIFPFFWKWQADLFRIAMRCGLIVNEMTNDRDHSSA